MSDTPAADALGEKEEGVQQPEAEAEPKIEKGDVEVIKEDKDDSNNLNEEEENARPKFSLKPTLIIIGAAIVGLSLGIGLSNGRGDPELISWIKLPGDLFIRALKAVVLPLVFVNIILAMVDMIRAGKASSVGWKTIALYTLTTLLASLEGLIFILIFQSKFKENNAAPKALLPKVRIGCPGGGFISELADTSGNLTCLDDGLEYGDQTFLLEDKNDFFAKGGGGGVQDDISFSQTLQDGIFRKLVSDNIVNEFVKANFVGIIVFAIVFGAASQSLSRQPKVVIELLEEMNRIFLLGIDWIILFTPIAVFSLIAGNIGGEDELSSVFKNIGFLMAATLLAMAFHFFITYPTLFILTVKKNPFKYYRYIIPAQTFAFASASSAATLPISLDCVAASGEVPKSITNFVLSMGATLNMDGGGIYFPTAIVFLAVTTGLGDQLDAAAYFLIVLLSTVGSAGTAPVPSASLVLIITAFNTVFDTEGTPDTFGLILAIDWLMDRFRTTLNVTGDTVMARVITAVANVSMEDDVLENEAVEGEDELQQHVLA